MLGGAAGSGYVFLGALERLEQLGLAPSYLAGCSVGSILAVIRARTAAFELDELLDDVRRLRERGVFRAPERPRFGLPGALRLDLRSALGELFEVDGRQQTPRRAAAARGRARHRPRTRRALGAERILRARDRSRAAQRERARDGSRARRSRGWWARSSRSR